LGFRVQTAGLGYLVEFTLYITLWYKSLAIIEGNVLSWSSKVSKLLLLLLLLLLLQLLLPSTSTSCCSSIVIMKWTALKQKSHVTRYTSHVTRHKSLNTRHVLKVTLHTSHFTLHTSHVTRHTSHIITTHTCRDPTSQYSKRTCFRLERLKIRDV
jgi:hypothetical protein